MDYIQYVNEEETEDLCDRIKNSNTVTAIDQANLRVKVIKAKEYKSGYSYIRIYEWQ
jgi:hypothetical protein